MKEVQADTHTLKSPLQKITSFIHTSLLWLSDLGEPTSGMAEALTMTAFFSLMVTDLLSALLKTIAFPLSTALSVLNSFSTWTRLYKEKHENGQINGGTLAKACMYTGITLLSTATVLVTLVVSSFATFIAPLIFTVASAAKTLFNFGSAIWYASRAYSTHEPTKKNEYKQKAITYAASGMIGAILTVTIGLTLLAAKPIFAVLGAIGGAAGTVFAAKGIYDHYKARKPHRCSIPIAQEPPIKKPSCHENLNQNKPKSPALTHPAPGQWRSAWPGGFFEQQKASPSETGPLYQSEVPAPGR